MSLRDAVDGELIELEPRAGDPINRRLALVRGSDHWAIMLGSTPLHVWNRHDDVGLRVACVAVVSGGLATRRDMARVLHLHENTVQRWVRGGLPRVLPKRRGRPPGSPDKVTAAVRAHLHEARRRGLNGTQARQWLQDEFGIALSRTAVFSALQQLARDEVEQTTMPGVALAPEVFAAEAADDQTEGAPCRVGALPMSDVEDELARTDAPVVLPHIDQGRYMGLALYYAALAAVGLVDVARATLRLRWSERFGVRAVVLTLFFLSLLRKTTLESAKHLRRREFGAVVGSERAPCVKTLRRKLVELGDLGQGMAFGRALARHWVDHALVSTAHLYVDGHVKVYSGKRRLEEPWNSQRRMPLPGVMQYFVGDQLGRPLLVVSEGVSPSLSKSLPTVVAAVREVIGERPLTLIFDRGGYDGKLFAWLQTQHIDFITYQRGPNIALHVSGFQRREARFEGRRIRLNIAEDAARVGRSGPWRRIVVRTKIGHQTPILTSLPDSVAAARIACLMFARWRQENFFKYMRQHHGLDTLVSNAFREAPDQLIPNPERKRLQRQLAAKRAEIRSLHGDLGNATLAGTALTEMRAGVASRVAALEIEVESLLLQRRIVDEKVTVAAAGQVREVMELERKRLVDQVKLAAYNAEEWLLDRLTPHYRNPFDARDLLRAFAELPGSIHTTADAVLVTLDPPDTPAHRTALRGLCADLNQLEVRFPGTERPVRYEVRVHHSEWAA